MSDQITSGSSPLLPITSGFKVLRRTLWKPVLPCNLRTYNSHNRFLAIISVSTVFLLLTNTVSPAFGLAAPGKPVTSVNPHSKNLAACNSEADCDSAKTYLRCSNKQCQCSLINFFDEEINRCLIRAGAACTKGNQNQFCVAYANCESPNKSSNNGQCKCRSKYKETIDNLCSGAQSSYRQHYVNFLLSSLPVAVLTILISQHNF